MDDGGGYIGFILPDEEPRGQYHDFSLTINPSLDGKPWHVNICIGTLGFQNDSELASLPGVRRLFSKLVDSNGFCKSDFSDMETSLPKYITQHPGFAHFKNTSKKYGKFYTAIQLIEDPESEEGKQRILAFLAAYAKMREWPTNGEHRGAIDRALAPFHNRVGADVDAEVEQLLRERRFLVLQGPPGTGKTRLAKRLVESLDAVSLFTQFHAETSYSDFIAGIRPATEDAALKYIEKPGTFAQAVDFAIKNPGKNTVLIIDEINRANLSNVLGPVFYLFEHKMDDSSVEIEIAPGLIISELPKNLFVVATMNTADRSLAVVDFALRRRFAWYTLRPETVKSATFHEKDFQEISQAFEWYATSDELSLQPGQGYFFADSEAEMLNRIRYEIFPLIKEYLQEGLLLPAKEEFNTYFEKRIEKSLFE
ncbi:MAG TPA: AAA family ATPase [Pyrinomonadaceae bacterium]|nr:AAA family ATPase [Pyrinomonadaceae bacterium]